MKIAVLSAYSSNFVKMADLSRNNKKNYCLNHGYDFIEDNDYPNQGEGRKASQWYKILSILKYLDMYDYIMWSDIDTLIMNPSIKLESLIDDRHHLFFGGYEYHKNVPPSMGCLVHSGNFIIKNSKEAKNILTTVFYNPEYYEYDKRPNHEETAFTQFISQKKQYWYLIKISHIKNFSSWIPIPVFNSLMQENIESKYSEQILRFISKYKYISKYDRFIMPINWYNYEKGDFILHISSPATYQERCEFIKYIFNNFPEFI